MMDNLKPARYRRLPKAQVTTLRLSGHHMLA
jgi:hypothetical protein